MSAEDQPETRGPRLHSDVSEHRKGKNTMRDRSTYETAAGPGLLVSVLLLATFALSVSGCASPDVEARLAELEAQVEALSELEGEVDEQKQATAMLGSVASVGRGSIFDSPLQRFFDAPEFWEVVQPGSEFVCHQDCARDHGEDALEACGEDEECRDQVIRDLSACDLACGGL